MTTAPAPQIHTVDFDALHQLGGAVFTAQMFEALFVIVARSALKYPDALDFEAIAPFSDKAFKQPVAALLKELSRANQIDPNLGDRISTWIENRHTLVHRLFLQKPYMSDADFWVKMKHLSQAVYLDSSELCAELLKLFMAYAAKMPESQAWLHDQAGWFESFTGFASDVRRQMTDPAEPGHG